MSDNCTAETIVEFINSHIANLSASALTQSYASNDANTDIFNASMQQMAANEAQHNNEHARMLQQFATMTTNQPGPQQFANQRPYESRWAMAHSQSCANTTLGAGVTMSPSRGRGPRWQQILYRSWPSQPTGTSARRSSPLCRGESDESLHPHRCPATPATESQILKHG